jgi:hypothetical protein
VVGLAANPLPCGCWRWCHWWRGYPWLGKVKV